MGVDLSSITGSDIWPEWFQPWIDAAGSYGEQVLNASDAAHSQQQKEAAKVVQGTAAGTSVPTWVWYLVGAGVLWYFFLRR